MDADIDVVLQSSREAPGAWVVHRIPEGLDRDAHQDEADQTVDAHDADEDEHHPAQSAKKESAQNLEIEEEDRSLDADKTDDVRDVGEVCRL